MFQFEIIRMGQGGVEETESLSNTLLARLRPFAKIGTRSLKESAFSADTLEKARKTDSARMQEAFQTGAFHVVLGERGKTFDSKQFATWIDRVSEGGARPVQFFIAGAPGIDASIEKEADQVLSLSPMTFTHDMAHVLLLEQIYRAMTILKGKTYHY